MVSCIIAGDRNTNERDIKFVEEAIKQSGFEIDEVVSGCARGADRLGEIWARKHGIPIKKFPADWKNLDAPGAIIKTGQYGDYNAKAGFDRNQQMANYADALIALEPNGLTDGTLDMIKRAEERGLSVFIFPPVKRVKAEFAYTFGELE